MPQADRLSEGAVKLLQEKQLAHFATITSGDAPQITPVWVDVELDGSYVLINTAEGRFKTENIRRNPEVAVSVVDRANDWRYVVVRGTVVELRHEGADEHIDKMAQKYLGQETYPFRRSDEQRVILRIKPHHVLELGV
jgi:PPOX class probable F420-dependent enzyme